MSIWGDIVNELSNTPRYCRSNNLRGGYAESKRGYFFYHAVYLTDGELMTEVPPILQLTTHLAHEQAKATWNEFVFDDVPRGEICIRWVFYPAKERMESNHSHFDACFLTVPILDTSYPLGTPFYGAVAQHFIDASSLKHSFQWSDKDRIYVVAFCQTKRDMIGVNGMSSSEMISHYMRLYGDYNYGV